MGWNRKVQTGGRRDQRAPRLCLPIAIGLVGFGLALPRSCWAQTTVSNDQGVHYRWSQQTPPGMIGSWQLQRGVGPVGYTQPIRLVGPPGLVADFGSGQVPVPSTVALSVGQMHRFHITGLPEAPGDSLWPTIEIIDRLHPPVGSKDQFPVLVEIEPEEIEMARAGALVTKVIYLEEPDRALPTVGGGDQLPVLDVGPDRNPIQVADVFGRPVAILRLGSWAPLDNRLTTQAIPGIASEPRPFGRGTAVVPASYPEAAGTAPVNVPLSQVRDRVYR